MAMSQSPGAFSVQSRRAIHPIPITARVYQIRRSKRKSALPVFFFSNHFHLLVKLRDPREVSAMMAGLLRAYVHRGVSGPGIGTSGAARGVAQVPADGRSA
jgi:hypothetical protein